MLDPLSFAPIPSTPRPLRPGYPTRRLLQPSPDHPDDYILELDYSSTSKLLECARAGENYLIHSREADRSHSATDFGKLFHECEELRLRSGFGDSTAQAQRERVTSHFLTHPCSPTDHRTAPRMLAVLKQYEERYRHDEWNTKAVTHEGVPFIERPFKIPLCSVEVNQQLGYGYRQLVADPNLNRLEYHIFIRNIHVVYTGRVDLAIHDSNLIYGVDHKTSSLGGSSFEDYFRLSLQTRGYTWALKKILPPDLAAKVRGFIVNALVIKSPTKAIFNNTELNRHTYYYSDASLAEWEENMRAHVTTFITNLIRGFFPQTCLSFKSPCSGCDYHQNCQLDPDKRPADLASPLFRDVTWSPLH